MAGFFKALTLVVRIKRVNGAGKGVNKKGNKSKKDKKRIITGFLRRWRFE